jgi:hypothetical protein
LTFSDSRQAEENVKENFVPEALHACVGYKRQGKEQLEPNMQVLFDFIDHEVELPSDFEVNKKYGSLSGTCFEERLLSAFIHGLLDKFSSSSAKQVKPEVRKLVLGGDFAAAANLVSQRC